MRINKVKEMRSDSIFKYWKCNYDWYSSVEEIEELCMISKLFAEV